MNKIDHVNLTVNDLDKSIAWYGKYFGFKPVEGGIKWNGRRWAILACDDSMIAMTEYPSYLPADQDSHGRHRMYHFGIRIQDVDKWRKQVEEDRIKILYGDGEVQYPQSLSWYVSDPSGHEIEVSWADGKPLTFPGYSD
jgi:lactoylglutathione lyase